MEAAFDSGYYLPIQRKLMIKPFFSRQLQDYVVDEMCECGHLKSDHGSLNRRINDRVVRLSRDEGSCCKGKCKCPHFTWERWVTADEAADLVIAARVSVA